MTVSLNCHLSLVNAGLEDRARIPDLPNFIRQHLLAGSHGDIALTCTEPQIVANPAAAGTPVTALQLHNYLLQINQNPSNAPVSNICVLFAASYQALPAAFGIMFDRGFTTPDDRNNAEVFLEKPRQGCAVFLNTIFNNRTADQYTDEALFTTVHELGHLFNLQHDESCLNFMRVSEGASFGPPAFLFTPFEQSRLEVCSTDANVMPGASNFGSDGAYNVVSSPKAETSKDLKLTITLSREVLWQFEPTQLELELALTNPSSAPASIPEIIDPANSQFRILIENNLGERALYRPPHRTCGPTGTLSLAPGKPYRRDFPLFGQAGGYTFRSSGEHRVWVELELQGEKIRSNVLKVHIQREFGLSAIEKEARAVLRTPQVASLLFHREDSGDEVGLYKLARYAEKVPDSPAAAEINYSLAKAILKQSSQPRSGREFTVRHARRFLEKALSFKDLGSHKHMRSETMLSDLDHL